jgi:rhodanese-related sulfurtransferase
MSGGGTHVFLDVRTVAEFDAGHPAGSINIPWALKGVMGMSPNPDFLKTVQKHVPKDARIFVSCKMGGRSMHACNAMAGAGYVDLINIDGGFGGRPDPEGGPPVKGWAEAGLPVENDPSTYEALNG